MKASAFMVLLTLGGRQVKVVAFMLLLTLGSGCASEVPDTTGPADLKYRRADTRIEATEEFERRKEACAQAGGTLQVRRMSGARQPPRVKEMKAATCVMVGGAGIF